MWPLDTAAFGCFSIKIVYNSATMNKPPSEASFSSASSFGIIFDQVAIGIIAGLILGAGAGKVTAPKSGPAT